MTRQPLRWICLAAVCLAGFTMRPSSAEESTLDWPSRQIELTDELQKNKPPVVTAVALHPDGGYVAAAGDDHAVRLWSIAEGQLLHMLRGHTDWVRTVAFSPDGKTLATAGNDHRIILWDVERGVAEREFAIHEQVVAAIAYNHAGDVLAAAGFESQLYLYDAATGEKRLELACPCRDMRALAFSPDDALLAAAGRNGAIRVWEVATGQAQRDLPAHRQRVRGLAFSPDGASLVSCSEDRLIRVWNPHDDEFSLTLPRRACKVMSIAFVAPNVLAAGGSDNLIRIWDLAEPREVGVLQGHSGSIAALASYGDLMVSGSYDATVRVWRIGAAYASQPHNMLPEFEVSTPVNSARR